MDNLLKRVVQLYFLIFNSYKLNQKLFLYFIKTTAKKKSHGSFLKFKIYEIPYPYIDFSSAAFQDFWTQFKNSLIIK